MKELDQSQAIACKQRGKEYRKLALYFNEGNETRKKAGLICMALAIDYTLLSVYYGMMVSPLPETKNLELNFSKIYKQLEKKHYELANQFDKIGEENDSEKEYWKTLGGNQRSISYGQKNYAEILEGKKDSINKN